MGKRSTKENKNFNQICREEDGLTREKASELMQFVPADLIEKIESEKEKSPSSDRQLQNQENKPYGD